MPARMGGRPGDDATPRPHRGPESADAQDIGELLRELAPQVLGALVRRYGQFGACEDAVQEAILEAVATWPDRGLPQNPKGWLITVASRRLIDEIGRASCRERV